MWLLIHVLMSNGCLYDKQVPGNKPTLTCRKYDGSTSAVSARRRAIIFPAGQRCVVAAPANVHIQPQGSHCLHIHHENSLVKFILVLSVCYIDIPMKVEIKTGLVCWRSPRALWVSAGWRAATAQASPGRGSLIDRHADRSRVLLRQQVRHSTTSSTW